MRLLLSNSVRNRCSLGKPSRRVMALSVRSMLSNWFCADRTLLLRRFEHNTPHGQGLFYAARTSVTPRFSMTDSLLPADSSTAVTKPIANPSDFYALHPRPRSNSEGLLSGPVEEAKGGRRGEGGRRVPGG